MQIVEYKKSVDPLKQRTLCFLLKDDQVLLGLKKTGFGKGHWLGIGGKVEEGESLKDAVIRETLEEVSAEPLNFERVATLNFYFPHVDEPHKWNQQVCVFTSKEWQGDILETDEIAPQWFEITKIPLDSMWDDAQYWLPNILQGEKLRADFLFDKTLTVKEHEVQKE